MQYQYVHLHVTSDMLNACQTEKMFTWTRGVSQDLELGCPNLLEISKQGVQIVPL